MSKKFININDYRGTDKKNASNSLAIKIIIVSFLSRVDFKEKVFHYKAIHKKPNKIWSPFHFTEALTYNASFGVFNFPSDRPLKRRGNIICSIMSIIFFSKLLGLKVSGNWSLLFEAHSRRCSPTWLHLHDLRARKALS